MCSGSKSIWSRSYIAAANGWTSWPGISLGSRIAAESFSGADAVPGFYGKPDAVYRLRRRSRIIALHIARTSKHPLSACVCGCLRTFEPIWANVCGCLRTRPKCLGMTCRCVCECLRPRKTAALHAVTCLRMSAEGETKEFLLLTDVCGLGDQNHPEARSKTVGFRFLCSSMPWCKYCNLSWRRNSF